MLALIASGIHPHPSIVMPNGHLPMFHVNESQLIGPDLLQILQVLERILKLSFCVSFTKYAPLFDGLASDCMAIVCWLKTTLKTAPKF
jgi:hypothetical protein